MDQNKIILQKKYLKYKIIVMHFFREGKIRVLIRNTLKLYMLKLSIKIEQFDFEIS